MLPHLLACRAHSLEGNDQFAKGAQRGQEISGGGRNEE